MIVENVSTLKIHRLTQEQYERELAAGNIDENALYLTPEEEIDYSSFVTQEQLASKADVNHGIHVEYSDSAPEMSGEAFVGVATTVARSDHRHPTDITRASQIDFELATNRLNQVESKQNSFLECSEEDILALF